jgi:hypothetical protein
MVPVLTKAKNAGIVVISHEAQQVEGVVDCIVEDRKIII